MRHVPIYRESGHFVAWPANNGMWCWGDEILVGATHGEFAHNGIKRHSINDFSKITHDLFRSLDGGETWNQDVHDVPPVGFQNENPTGFAFRALMENPQGGLSQFYFSNDRGRSWSGPFRFNLMGRQGMMARTDYVVVGDSSIRAFVTIPKQSGGEGIPVCIESRNGGITWSEISKVGAEPKWRCYRIMPSTVLLGAVNYLMATRCKNAESKCWIELFESRDDCFSWIKISEIKLPDGAGNPPAMTKLSNGHIVITYGYREYPWAIQAVRSIDNGKTWCPAMTLRQIGDNWDMGYTRNVQRNDGKIVTVYYASEPEECLSGIHATIWDESEVFG